MSERIDTLRNVSRLVPELLDRSLVRAVLNYPTIVCNQNELFFLVDMEDENASPRPAEDGFVFEINYAWLNSANHNITEYFLVDIVSANGLKGLLAEVEADAKRLGWQLGR